MTPAPKMRPVTEWSCPLHSYPHDHYCDCQYCTHSGWECELCATAEYVKVLNEDGTVKMVEELPIETIMREHYLPPIIEQLNKETFLLKRFGDV